MAELGGLIAIAFGLILVLVGIALVYRYYFTGPQSPVEDAEPLPSIEAVAVPDGPAPRRYTIPIEDDPAGAISASATTPTSTIPAPARPRPTMPIDLGRLRNMQLPWQNAPRTVGLPAGAGGSASLWQQRPLSDESERITRLREMRERLHRQSAPEFIEAIPASEGAPAESDAPTSSDGPIIPWQRVPNNQLPELPAIMAAPTPESATSEVIEDPDSAPAGLQWRGGRAPRDTSSWREAAQGYVVPRSRRGLLMPVVVGSLTILLVGGLIWTLLGNRAEGAALPPGAAIIVVADFGEGADYADSAAGRNTADSLRKEVATRLGNNSRLIVRTAGRINSPEKAVDEAQRQNASAVLWGTLPEGAAGTISATLTWRTTPPADPWLRYGPAGRLIMPLNSTLPDQPLVAGAALAPLMAAVLQYQAGFYDDARRSAESISGEAPASTINVGGFLRANALLTVGQEEDAAALYEALEARGWRPAALYNNWGIALTLAGSTERAAAVLNSGLEIAPPPPDGDMALQHSNRASVAQIAGDRNLAKAEYSEALKLKPDNRAALVFPYQQLGYMLYQEGDTSGAGANFAQASALAPDNAYTMRNQGLLLMMERGAAPAQAQFVAALGVFKSWKDQLSAQAASSESLGDTAAAVRANEQARELNFELGTTQYYIGLALADQAADAPPENFFAGIIRRIQGKQSLAEQAISAFEEAIRLDSDREDVRYQMGVMYRKNGDNQQAAAQFARAKELDPSATGAYEQLAEMYVADKRLDKAAAEYETLLAQNPGYLRGYIALAEIYSGGNNPEAARQAYQRALGVTPQNARDNYYRARAAYLLALESNPPDPGLLGQAVAEAQAATGDPGIWEAHLLLGEIALLNGQSDVALAEYNLVLEQQPDNVDALYPTGKLLAASGQRDAALQAWTRVVQLKPRHPSVHLDLGALYESGDPPDIDKAIAEYKSAIDIDSSKAEPYLRLGELYGIKASWGDAAGAYSEALKRNLDLVEAWQGMAHAQLRQPGKDGEALQTAESFRQHAPSDSRAYLLLGEVFLARNDHAAAITQLEQALRLSPGSPEAYFGLGRAYALRGDRASAEQYYNAALQARPNYAEALTSKGDLLYDDGRYGEALDSYNRALQIEQNYAPAYAGLGRVLNRTATRSEDYDEARRKLERAIQLDPTYAEPHSYLGDMYSERAMWDEAIREYTLAARLRPAWALPQFRLGQIYLTRTKLPEAIAAFTAATTNDPNLIEAWFGLAQAERASGKRKEAIAHYRQAITLNNNYAIAWLNLGYTLEEDGQRADAANAFRSARDLSGDDRTIRQAAEEALKRYQ